MSEQRVSDCELVPTEVLQDWQNNTSLDEDPDRWILLASLLSERAENAKLRAKIERVDKLPTYYMTKENAKMEVISAFALSRALSDEPEQRADDAK